MYRVLVATAALLMSCAQARAGPPQEEIDRYLFVRVYEPSAKWDSTGDFTHKDPAAAWRTGKSLQAFVIGGMDPSFRRLLYFVARSMELDGLAMCMTSGYRDAERQRMITKGLGKGLRASYHGGNGHGYGHGTAADVVGCPEEGKDRWAANRAVWRWIDEHGAAFGLGRPYGNYDPPHVGPIDGPEYRGKAHVRARHGTELEPPRARTAKAKRIKKKRRKGKRRRTRLAKH